MRKDTKNAAPVAREMIRSSTLMGDAFVQAAANSLAAAQDGARSQPSENVQAVVDALTRGSGIRKRPAWTVSKRPEKTNRKARK